MRGVGVWDKGSKGELEGSDWPPGLGGEETVEVSRYPKILLSGVMSGERYGWARSLDAAAFLGVVYMLKVGDCWEGD